MDFSKFRASGDLSDLVVVVEGQENHLHRFPLFAKSDFFCGLARGPGMTQSPPSAGKQRVDLPDFPGGQAVFSVVADFCYNMAPKVTKDNVVQLRCAARYLEMTGPANLAEAADRYLQDILTSAKLNRSSGPLVTLLLQCASVGPVAAECGVVDACTDALVDTLLRSPAKFSPGGPLTGGSSSGGPATAFALQGSAFTPTRPASAQTLPSPLSPGRPGPEDEQSLGSLCRLPEDWFADFLRKGSERGVLQPLLADLALRYVSRAIDKNADDKNRGAQGGGINGHSTPIDAANSSGGAVEVVEDVEDLDKDIDSLGAELNEVVGVIGESPFIPDREVDLGQLLDTVLTTLPEEAYNVPGLTLDWLTKVLRIATSRGCSCRQFLVKIAGDMLTRLPAEELCLVSPSVLHDVVLEARADDSQTERACLLVDTYLAQMAKKGVLTADTFRLLANAMPAEVRRNHDSLYEVLEYVLKSEKDSLSEEQRKELLATIDLNLVSEDTLQRALASELVAAEPVARAALRLCGSLRSELESVKYIAQMQEEELQKYQARAAASASASASPHASPRLGPAFTALKIPDSDSGFSDNNQETKVSPDSGGASEHVRAAQSVLSTARSKLAMPLYTGHRPYLPSSTSSSSSHHGPLHSSSSSGAYPSTLEQDLHFQEELELRLDRSSFRTLEPRGLRTRHLPGLSHRDTTGNSSHHHHHHHRSTYFPYSPRF